MPLKRIFFRNYEVFHEAKFVNDLDQEMIKCSFYQRGESFAVFSSVFSDMLDRHATIQAQTVRGSNEATKQLNK